MAVTLALAAATAAAAPVGAGPKVFPDVISLPDGFQPEGIASGRGSTFFVGSIPTGAIYRGDFRTGEGEVLVPGASGRSAIGLEEHHGLLFVAGGATGMAFVYDADTGADVAALTLTTEPAFVNDVVVTRTAAFFTDSFNPVLYRVDLDTFEVTTLPLTGDLQYQSGFNVNGIDATPNGKRLVLVQSNTGKLFLADPRTGETEEIRLADGEAVTSGDGILLSGHTLYVVQNQLNVVATIRLSGDLTSGTVIQPHRPSRVRRAHDHRPLRQPALRGQRPLRYSLPGDS